MRRGKRNIVDEGTGGHYSLCETSHHSSKRRLDEGIGKGGKAKSKRGKAKGGERPSKNALCFGWNEGVNGWTKSRGVVWHLKGMEKASQSKIRGGGT